MARRPPPHVVEAVRTQFALLIAREGDRGFVVKPRQTARELRTSRRAVMAALNDAVAAGQIERKPGRGAYTRTGAAPAAEVRPADPGEPGSAARTAGRKRGGDDGGGSAARDHVRKGVSPRRPR